MFTCIQHTHERGAGSSGGGLGRDKLLQLASSLAAKQLEKQSECAEEEVLLHIHILQVRHGTGLQPASGWSSVASQFLVFWQARGQDAEALVALDSPLGSAIQMRGERERLRATLMVRAQRSCIHGPSTCQGCAWPVIALNAVLPLSPAC